MCVYPWISFPNSARANNLHFSREHPLVWVISWEITIKLFQSVIPLDIVSNKFRGIKNY
jgi:hypothetical protein